MNIAVAGMQWSNLDHISDVKPIGADDEDVLAEIREVLARHGCLGRFGLTLLHNHFEIDPDEVLLETTDIHSRNQTIRPVKKHDLMVSGVEPQVTVISFYHDRYETMCVCDLRQIGHVHRWSSDGRENGK